MMDQDELVEVNHPDASRDANDVDSNPHMEAAEEDNEDDWGPAFFEEEEECVELLSRVRKALLDNQKHQEEGKEKESDEDEKEGYDIMLPTAAEDPQGVAAALERFERIVTRYQESPHLLHGSLEILLGPLVSMMQLLLPTASDVWRMEKSKKDVGNENNDNSDAAYEESCHVLGKNYDEYDADAAKTAIHHISRAIYIVVKTAGEKCCTSYFSNDVKLYEDVFYALRWWQGCGSRRREWEVRYCLLLWLSNLVLVPFSLSIIDSVDGAGSLSDAVLQTAMVFLSDTSKCREGAALLVARLLTRPDGEVHRVRFFDYAQKAIADNNSSSLLLHGVLIALAKTLKCGQRSELAPYAAQLIPSVAGVFETRNNDVLLCKAAVKVVQRLALTMLKSCSAPWKYHRHVAALDRNLAATVTDGNNASVSRTEEENEQKDNNNDNENNDNENNNNDDDDYVIENDEGLEDAIGLLLVGISHRDTVVRWSASKGIGRICDRLPRSMSNEVIDAVLDVFSNENSDSGWHGGLLTVAELCRRSILHPQHLAIIMSFITKGLVFDLIKGTYSVGSHVRDAACYACWSIARAYDASDIEEHVHKLSTSLVVTSLFDREVHVRRAAAAAFQECVGRLGNFPDGIRLVTTMDFFSLASLQNAYLRVAPVVAENAAYRERMLEELVVNKLLHWDRRVRCCAARALGLLATQEVSTIMREVMPELLRRATDNSIATRHGAILAIAELVDALDASVWPSALIDSIAALTPRVDAARLFRSRGGEYVRQACCRLLAAVARRRLKLPEMVEVPKVTGGVVRARTLGKLQEFFEDTWKQILEWLQFDAVEAYEVFATTYYTEFTAPFHHKVLEKMLDGSSEDRNPMERRGNILAMGALPWCILSAAPMEEKGESAYMMLLLRATMKATVLEKRKEAQDAESRRNAVRSLRKLLLRIPAGTSYLTQELYEEVLEHILDALGDYAADRRGDVGSFVRLEAINSLTPLVQYGLECKCAGPQVGQRVACALLKQSMEKLDRLRGRAVVALQQLVSIPEALPDNADHSENDNKHINNSTNSNGHNKGDNNDDDDDDDDEKEGKKKGESDIELLRRVLSEEASLDWSSPQVVFTKLAYPLLQTELFAPCVAEGLAVSAGTLSVHIMRPAVEAFLSAFRSSQEDRLRLSQVLIAIAAKYTHNERVIVPLCSTIDTLINASVFDEARHMDVVEILRNELKHFSTNILVLLPLVGVLGGLCRSSIREAREAAWGLSLVMLASRYPKVRAKMATDMYTSLLVLTSSISDEAEESETLAAERCARAMHHLTVTQWDGSEAVKVRSARDELYDMLGITRPTKEIGNNTVEEKKKANRIVAGSYLYLVQEAGY
ncbi:tubulin folding cofactor D [Trypanosoma theileri]|uniref:Tubulin folding cofactor D n=1 Tax=Trypanosoma theileri TaxID=67003 RepID=A0A1X0NW58_9TRYP|nr:tubulin folding cofactor D [Trypanosoma theileri]ORC88851.1 tubulin folding cofactor D [Trypanosoma theileri]